MLGGGGEEHHLPACQNTCLINSGILVRSAVIESEDEKNKMRRKEFLLKFRMRSLSVVTEAKQMRQSGGPAAVSKKHEQPQFYHQVNCRS
jgi:hypothetical protein